MSKDEKQPHLRKVQDDDSSLNEFADVFAKFLRDPSNKRRFHEFLMDHYRDIESGKVEQLINRLDHMRNVDEVHASDIHEPSNISSLLQNNLGMSETEQAFVESLVYTKSKLVQTAKDAASDIKNTMRDVSGINQNIEPWQAKHIAAYLQFQDPKKKHRDMIMISVHVKKTDLQAAWTASGNSMDDAWDQAVTTMTRSLDEAGLKTTYVKNDRLDKHLVMRQELVSQSPPDEYFAIRLEYETPEKLKIGSDNFEKMKQFYLDRVVHLKQRLLKLEKANKKSAWEQTNSELQKIRREQDFFFGTVPDPSQLDEGLLMTIEIATTKDYHFIRNKMQTFVKSYLNYLVGKDQRVGYTDQSRKKMNSNQEVIEYEVDERHLRPIRRKSS